MKTTIYITLLALSFGFISCERNKNHAGNLVEDSSAPNKAASIFGSSPSSQELDPSAYVKWIKNPDNGLVKAKTIDKMIFSVLYKPSEYLLCQEERSNEISTKTYNQKLPDYSDLYYFDLKIEIEGGQGELLKQDASGSEDYDKRVKYYSFGLLHDITMVQNGDTIPCAMTHFERAFDITPYACFQIAFPKQKSKEGDLTIIFIDKIFGKGILKFFFNKDILSHLPKLKTS